MIDKDFELAGDLFNELDTQIFGETVQLCKECDIFVQHDDMACTGCCKDCSGQHDARWGKHER